MGITIDVIPDTIWGLDKSDGGFLQSQLDLRPHALRTLSIKNFVDAVTSRTGKGKIKLLRIYGHGGPGQQDVGGGIANANQEQELSSARAQTLMMDGGKLNQAKLLATLTPLFEKDATVELHGCNVAEGSLGRKFVYELARFWNVRVLASTGLEFADKASKFESPYIEMFPNGRANRRHGYSDVEPMPEDPETPFIDPSILDRHPVGKPVRREDMLSLISEKYYEGDRLLWPLIWERNKNVAFEGTRFVNPNRPIPGMTLIIPVKPAMTKQQLDTVHAQGRAWQAYN